MTSHFTHACAYIFVEACCDCHCPSTPPELQALCFCSLEGWAMFSVNGFQSRVNNVALWYFCSCSFLTQSPVQPPELSWPLVKGLLSGLGRDGHKCILQCKYQSAYARRIKYRCQDIFVLDVSGRMDMLLPINRKVGASTDTEMPFRLILNKVMFWTDIY